MNKEERQEYIIEKLDEIENLAQELMDIAITGEDGNLGEMSYHIKCYTNKITVHLLKEWKNNEKFAIRKNEKEKLKEKEKQEDEKEIWRLNKQIFEKFVK